MNTKFKLVALLFVTAVFISTGLNAQYIKGSGNIISETRSVDSFTSIHSKGSADVIITQGSTQSVVVESDENLMPHIRTDVRDGQLNIEIKKNYKNIDVLKVHITVADLESIEISGSGDIVLTNTFKTNDLSVYIKGSGDFKGDLDVKKFDYKVSGSGDGVFSGVRGDLKISVSGSGDVKASNLRLAKCVAKISGSGDMNLSGSVDDLVVSVAGSGDIDAYGMKAVSVKAKVAGSGEISVTAIDRIVAEIAGSGDIYYKGNPQNVVVSSSGSGDLIKR